MANYRDLKDLPEGFDPEEYSRSFPLENIKAEDLYEGVNLLYAEGNEYVLAKVQAPDQKYRCWHCQKSADGVIDCVQIPCPWDPQPAP